MWFAAILLSDGISFRVQIKVNVVCSAFCPVCTLFTCSTCGGSVRKASTLRGLGYCESGTNSELEMDFNETNRGWCSCNEPPCDYWDGLSLLERPAFLGVDNELAPHVRLCSQDQE